MAETFQNVYEMLSRPYFLLALAFILDLLIGDPEWLPHPVRAMGWLIGKMEKFCRDVLRITGQKSPGREKFASSLLALIVVCFTFGLFYLINLVFFTIHYSLFTSFVLLLIMVYLTATTLAAKGLIDSAKDVITALADKNIADARIKVGCIVGRDTDNLDEKGVLRATIESLAENASDGIIAPLFYFVIGGLPLAMTYKAINTMDSMVGYKNEKYKNFGWAAARLDDIANYIPARITGILIVIATFILGIRDWSVGISNKNKLQPPTPNPQLAFKTMLRDGRNHPSPNSGVPEAAIAGALGVRLGGPSTYGEILVEKQCIGENTTEDYSIASDNAVNIVKITSILGLVVALIVLYVRALL